MRYSSVKVFRVKCKAIRRNSFFSFRASFCRSALQQPHCLLAVHQHAEMCSAAVCPRREKASFAYRPPFLPRKPSMQVCRSTPAAARLLPVCLQPKQATVAALVLEPVSKLDSWLSSGSRPNVQAKARCTAAPPPCAATSPHAPRRRHRRSLRSFTHAPAASPGTAAQDLLQG